MELIRAMVNLLLVSRAVKMLVEPVMGGELAVAEVAVVATAVPCILGGPSFLMPFEQVIGD